MFSEAWRPAKTGIWQAVALMASSREMARALKKYAGMPLVGRDVLFRVTMIFI
jgi:hypothetical protein